MKFPRLLFSTLLLLSTPPAPAAERLEERSRSPIWQVRYCVPFDCEAPTPENRKVLERLSVDPHRGVAQQAFGLYQGVFVDLDSGVVRQAFERGDFDLVGAKVAGPQVFRTPAFWVEQLSAGQDQLTARALHALGLLGDKSVLAQLPAPKGANPYHLAELALACHRLGDDAKYLAALEKILELPVEKNMYYQNQAVEFLLQTHPARARVAWERVEQALKAFPDLQPNWVNAHYMQQGRLP